MPHARPRAVTSLQTLSQLLEHDRQLPAPVHAGVVQCGRTTAKSCQIVQRIEHLVARCVAPPVAGNQTAAMHNVHAIYVAFGRDRLERIRAWDAVLHRLESDQLILVDLRRLRYARIESVSWQSRCGLSILLELLADRLVRTVPIAMTLCQATFQQIRVQLVEVLRLGNRRRPATLKRFDPVLHGWLLVAASRHAKQRIEHVVTRQRGIA